MQVPLVLLCPEMPQLCWGLSPAGSNGRDGGNLVARSSFVPFAWA